MNIILFQYIHTYIHTYIHIYIYIYTCIYMYIYLYIYMSNIIHYLFLLTHTYHIKISTIFILKYYSNEFTQKIYVHKNLISFSYTYILSRIYKHM